MPCISISTRFDLFILEGFDLSGLLRGFRTLRYRNNLQVHSVRVEAPLPPQLLEICLLPPNLPQVQNLLQQRASDLCVSGNELKIA